MKRLIIMTKYPQPGQTKTRLIPALGAVGAADLHRQLGFHTVNQVRSLTPEIHLEIRYAGGNQPLMKSWLGDLQEDCHYVPQGDGDLGDRMARAFVAGFDEGYDRIVMIGTDCPSVDSSLIHRAFLALENTDIVFGPATDGGYYLIGLRKMIPDLFIDLAWSTPSVLSDSLAILDRLKIPSTLLETLSDIDRPEDLKHLSSHFKLNLDIES